MILKSLRLWWALNFQREKVKRSLSERIETGCTEDCIKCHKCCDGCPALLPDGKCSIWDKADYRCKNYPFFKWELEQGKNGDLTKVCRFRWNTRGGRA